LAISFHAFGKEEKRTATIHNHKKFHEPRELSGIALTFHLAWRKKHLLKKTP
jgi:hypothetical protein